MSDKEQVVPVIDSNEAAQNDKLTEVLVLHEDGKDFRIEPLPFGDIKIGECLFERKSPSDFASSLQEGRLEEQVKGLSATDMHAYILIEGNMEDFDDLDHTDIPPKSLRGMVARIETTYPVGVEFCSTPELLGDTAMRFARKHIEDPSEPKTMEEDRGLTFIEQVFMAIEGIGMKTAETLARSFPDIASAMDADQSDFKSIDGVGEKRAETIYETLHTENEVPEEESDDSNVVVVTI